MKVPYLKKSAFTMLELVFVIVVIGIISAVMIPRIDRDNLAEAANQVVSHIKYTQHLAMTENMYDDNIVNWFQRRWQIQFYACGGYAVHSDTDMSGGVAQNESAQDPQTKLSLFTTGLCTENATSFDKVVLSSYFDIVNIATAGCGGLNIGFDNLGRPYETMNLNGLLKQDCDITLTAGSGDGVVIRIVPETGYTYILQYI